MHTYSTDANHRDVIQFLEAHGVCVLDFAKAGDGCPDIAVWYRGITGFIEIKFGKDAKLKRSQALWLSSWPGHCGIARTPEEALELATGTKPYLYESKKARLAAYALTMPKEVRLATVMKQCAL